ncbi:hypothetical protein SLS62_000880 [Diatrype stigma]|uniref:Cytochrome P450 n=1 Tax=Diatrype stigma TaxID=117547 RepID=A0AAN9V3B7_9PEZI
MAYATLALSILAPLVFLIVLRSFSQLQSKRASKFPPGPPAIPLLGNLHQIPLTRPFLQFAEWSRTYGAHGLVGLHLGPRKKAVVLNSWQSVRDLLDQRGSIYSSRPRVPIVDYVVPRPGGGDIHLVFMPYGAKFRRARKTIGKYLRDDEVDKLVPIQDAESSQMMHELLRRPDRYHEHALRLFGAAIMASVFGVRGERYDDEGSKIRRFFEIQHKWASLLAPGSVPPLEVFPFLARVPDILTPWRGWKGRAERLRQRQSSLYHDLFGEAKERVEAGRGRESFVAALLRSGEGDAYGRVELDYITGFLMEGGSDTTAGAFETFVLAMAAHPSIQKQAQAEVDKVFGHDGVVAARARANDLPFLKAHCDGVRGSLGIPHATLQDDVYQGYVIPANTPVFMNTWAVNHDPDEYEQPDIFNPDRFLEHPLGIRPSSAEAAATTPAEGGPAVSDLSRRQSYSFGAGRRVCGGQRMAENSLMLTMSKLLWAFDVVAIQGLVDTDVQTAFKDAILTGPEEFAVDFQIRDGHRKEVVMKEWEKADEYLKRFE